MLHSRRIQTLEAVFRLNYWWELSRLAVVEGGWFYRMAEGDSKFRRREILAWIDYKLRLV